MLYLGFCEFCRRDCSFLPMPPGGKACFSCQRYYARLSSSANLRPHLTLINIVRGNGFSARLVMNPVSAYDLPHREFVEAVLLTALEKRFDLEFSKHNEQVWLNWVGEPSQFRLLSHLLGLEFVGQRASDQAVPEVLEYTARFLALLFETEIYDGFHRFLPAAVLLPVSIPGPTSAEAVRIILWQVLIGLGGHDFAEEVFGQTLSLCFPEIGHPRVELVLPAAS